jgi:hypothetical protein
MALSVEMRRHNKTSARRRRYDQLHPSISKHKSYRHECISDRRPRTHDQDDGKLVLAVPTAPETWVLSEGPAWAGRECGDPGGEEAGGERKWLRINREGE